MCKRVENLPVIAIIMAGAIANIAGCSTPKMSPDKSEQDSQHAAQDRLGVLLTRDKDEFIAACEKIYSEGYEVIPLLLMAARDDSLVAWTPPIACSSSGRIPSGITLGDVCIYLMESIRLHRYVHSVYYGYECKKEFGHSKRDCAYAEYKKWWEARCDKAGESTYEPKIEWQYLDPSAEIKEPVYDTAVSF